MGHMGEEGGDKRRRESTRRPECHRFSGTDPECLNLGAESCMLCQFRDWTRRRGLYDIPMRMLPPTQESLHEHLLKGGVARYGTTGEEVLATCSLIATASKDWSAEQIKEFQQSEDLNSKVWDKLVAIGKNERLHSFDTNKLPGSYTALYALVTLSQEEWLEALRDEVVFATAPARLILDWTRRFRSGDLDKDSEEVILTMIQEKPLSEQESADLFREINKVSNLYGARIILGRPGVRQRKTVEKERLQHKDQITQLLAPMLDGIIDKASEELRKLFEIESDDDLLNADMKHFAGFLMKLSGSREQFWKEYGSAYCLKIGKEFVSSESKAQRGNYKRRLKEVLELHFDNEEVVQTANSVLEDYMNV